MAVKFFKKTTPQYTIMPNATYADLFDNNKANTDIQSGTVSGVQTTSLFAADYNTAVQPAFGSAKLVGAKVGLYVNSITGGGTLGSAGLKAFKMNQEIGNREGGKESAGSLISNRNIAQFSCFHNNDTYIIENFAGAATDTADVSTETINTVVTQKIGPYLSEKDGYDFGDAFGGRSIRKLSRNTHHDRYGQTLADGTKIYKIEKSDTPGTDRYVSVKKKKLWWRRNTEFWKHHMINPKLDVYRKRDNLKSKIKYEREITVDIPPEPQQLTTDNSFFDIIKQAEVFRGTKSDSIENSYSSIRETFGDIAYSSSNVLNGGYSMHLNSLYMHRDNSISTPWYPYQKDLDGNDLRYSALQQTSFASKILPMPVEVGNTNDKDRSSQGGHSPTATIEIDANFEQLAPMLVRFENHTSALGGTRSNGSVADDTGAPMRFRLNRSYAITFGELPPTQEDTLFTYIKKHIPTAGYGGSETINSANTNPTWQKNGETQNNCKFTGNGGGTAATAEIVCHADISNNQAIHLTSYTGLTVVYTAKDAGQNLSNNEFDCSGTAAETAQSLRECIDHADGHNGTILTVRSPNDTLTLTQGYKGEAGNTTITETFDSSATVSAAFTGGVGTKSFFGTAFVNYDGHLSYYDLGPSANFAAGSNTPFDDIAFMADDRLGEICFTNAPTPISDTFNTWMRLSFQVDPELMGAYHSIYDANDGTVFRSRGVVRNVKTSKYTSANAANRKLKVVNRDEWPKYMTIWNNNYQAIKSGLSTSHGSYTSGLLHAEDTSGDARSENVLLYTDSTKDDSNGLKGIPFNLAKPGTSVRSASGSDATSNEIGIAEWATTTGGSGEVTIVVDSDSKDTSKNEPFVYDALFEVDSQVQGIMDMANSLFIDNIHLKHFNIQHSNATPNENNIITGRLSIPAPHEFIPFGYTLNASDPTNVYESGRPVANSYLCFGFDNYTDLGFATNISSSSGDKDFLMNDFDIVNSTISDKIITNIDSEQSHVRAGYTSSAEDYGIQGRSKFTQTYGGSGTQDPTTNVGAHAGYAKTGSSGALQESPFFDNNEGNPNYAERGLKVGNDSDGFELAIGSDTAYQIDRFTQKGVLTWNFNARSTDSTANLANSDGSDMDAGDVNVRLSDATVVNVNEYIKVDSEVMKITGKSGSVITVERGQFGTSDNSHNDGSDVYNFAAPEKRECLFVSARVLNVIDSKTVKVDASSIFKLKDETEYIIYKHGDSHASPTFEPRTLRVTSRLDNEITFDKPHGVATDESTKHELMISPKKYWVVIELTNVGGEITKTLQSSYVGASTITVNDLDGIKPYMAVKGTKGFISSIDASNNQITVTGTTISGSQNSGVTFEATIIRGNNNNKTKTFLPERSYQNMVGIITNSIDSNDRLGATFNEALYNDGVYLNPWNLEGFEDTPESVITLADYGFGDFDKDTDKGGHAGFLGLNRLNDVTKYKEIDVSGVIKTDDIKPNSALPLLISTDDPAESFKINIDTEQGTNKPYLLSIFEDEIPKITDFKLQPNKEDPFLIDYTWNCEDEDVWYGFLHVSDENIKDQYHGAIMHIPLNDDAYDNQTVSSFAVQDSDGDLLGSALFADTVGSSATYTPKHTVEGLAGNAVLFDSNDLIHIGATNNNCFSSIDKEMSVVIHCVNTGPSFNSGANQHLIRKGQALTNITMDIFARRVGLTNTGNIVVRLMSDGATTQTKHVELSSSTVIEKDVPLNIIVTFDANLLRGNCKLFINGRLEDQSGEVISTHAEGNNTGWIHKTDLYSANAPFTIGAKNESMVSGGWLGTIEEVVVYDRVIYPVEVSSGKFTFTKPLEELTSETIGRAKNYNARLFIKDYHNIRGSSKEDVAMSPNRSYRKASFNIGGN